MRGKTLELGSRWRNVFGDLGRDNADVTQLRALPADEIIKALDRGELTVQTTQARAGFTSADFSRIQNTFSAGQSFLEFLQAWPSGHCGPFHPGKSSRKNSDALNP